MIPVVARAGATAGPPSVSRVRETPSGHRSDASHSPETTACGRTGVSGLPMKNSDRGRSGAGCASDSPRWRWKNRAISARNG